jgi:uncharacterized membrane protein
MSDVQPVVAPAKPGKGLRIALAVSVAINLAVAGLVAGAAFKHGGDGGRMEAGRELGFGPFSEALNRDDRRALRDAFIAKAPELRDTKRQRRDDTQALLAALRAEPFAPDALAQIMERQHQRLAGQLQLGQDLLRDFLVAMTPEARAAFADRLEERLRPDKDASKAN